MNGKEHIQSILRVVKDHDWNNNPIDRVSIGGEEPYVKLIQDIYEYSSPVMKSVFHSLKRINIETDMKLGAYAMLYRNAPGATLGIRKIDIDINNSLGEGLSRKEQLSFGLDDSNAFNTNLPYFISEDNPIVNNYLFYVISHEFGHLLDWKNEISLENSEWTNLSWQNTSTPNKNNDYTGRSEFRFYEAEGDKLGTLNYPEMYKSLFQSSFVSTYSSLDPDEDFAETFAQINTFENLKTKLIFRINMKGLSLSERISSDLLKPKVQFIKDFLTRKDLIFP